MYVPKKLQPYFVINNEKYGANIIIGGSLSCCGRQEFSIDYKGKIKSSLFGHKFLYQSEDNIILQAKCKTCGKEILIFNSDTDGYDSCEHKTQEFFYEKLDSLSCPNCKGMYFSLDVSFEYQSKEELEKEGIKEYENAFSWIWCTIICESCGGKLKKFIDIETA